MRKVACAAVLAACFGVAGVAQAADLSYPGSLKDGPYWSPAALWSGLYVGGHIGGAWGDVDVTDTYEFPIDPTVESSLSTTGLIGGAQIGYNIQRGRIVYGIEGDLGYLSLSESKAVALQRNLSAAYELSGGLYGDLTGRLGYAADKTLFYIKGGAAFLNMDYNSQYDGKYYDQKPRYDFSHSKTMWGWTLGAGVEHKLSPSLSLKAEYQHFDFGSASFEHVEAKPNNSYSWPYLTTNAEISPTVDAVKLGVNYNLNGTGAALK